jgi:hypothetical protein
MTSTQEGIVLTPENMLLELLVNRMEHFEKMRYLSDEEQAKAVAECERQCQDADGELNMEKLKDFYCRATGKEPDEVSFRDEPTRRSVHEILDSPFMRGAKKISGAQILAEIKREAFTRLEVYPAWVKEGRISERTAQKRIAASVEAYKIVSWYFSDEN